MMITLNNNDGDGTSTSSTTTTTTTTTTTSTTTTTNDDLYYEIKRTNSYGHAIIMEMTIINMKITR